MHLAWRHKRTQSAELSSQATLTAGTILEATKLLWTTWFLAFYPSSATPRTGISSLALRRHLGVKLPNCNGCFQNKIMPGNENY